jgi:hypothetical protein
MPVSPVTDEEVEEFLRTALERSQTPRQALVVWHVSRLVDYGRAHLTQPGVPPIYTRDTLPPLPRIPRTFCSLGGGLTQRIQVSEVLWVTAAVGALMVLCWFLLH